MTQTLQIKCECCEGYKRVAVLRRGPPLFGDIYNKPMAVTYAKARKLLQEYKGGDAGAVTMLVKRLVAHLDTAPCPHCNATGIAYTLTFGDPS